MAQFAHLPIYKKSYDLALFMHCLTITFPREHRYTFGAGLKENSIELLLLIIQANSKIDKREVLEKASEKLEEIKILVRLGHDLKIIGIKKYEESARISEEIGMQLGGWIKSQNKSNINLPESNRLL
ncbi:MAG: four helix bundle protein [bacterium]|nr:four helix bundle protein [bacterium]